MYLTFPRKKKNYHDKRQLKKLTNKIAYWLFAYDICNVELLFER